MQPGSHEEASTPSVPSTEGAAPRGKPSRAKQIDGGLRGLAWIGLEALAWPTALGLLVGVAWWSMVQDAATVSVTSRLKETPVRADAMAFAWWGVVAMWCLHGVVHAVTRARRGAWHLIPVARGVNVTTLPLAMAPLLIALASKGIEVSRPVFTYGLIVVAACSVFPVASRVVPRYRALLGRAVRRLRSTRRVRWWLGLAAVTGIWLTYGAWFSEFAIHHHRSFRTSAFDLGIYDNLFYRSLHGDWLGCSLIKGEYHGTAHFDPIIILLSPLYGLKPGAETLLTLQSYWLGAAVFPMYLLAWHRCKSAWVGVALAGAIAFYPAMQGANMYEFHSLSLLGMPLLWLMYFLARGAVWRYLLALVVCLLVREDASLVLCFVGAAALLSRRRVHPRLGLLTIVVSLSYFVVVKSVFMASSDMVMNKSGAYSFAYYYKDLIPKKGGMTGLIVSLVTNPGHGLGVALAEAKMLFVLGLFVPVLFLPVWGGAWRVTLIYGAAFLLLASRRPVFSLYFQYSTVIYPLIFALVPEALLRLRARGVGRGLARSRAAFADGVVCSVLVASTLCCWKFGGVWENKTFRAGFTRPSYQYTPTRADRYEEFEALIGEIPAGAAVTASKRLAPHVSARRDIYLPRQKKKSEYELLEVTRMKKSLRRRHDRRVKKGQLVEIGRSFGVVLFEVPEKPVPPKKPRKRASKRRARGPKAPVKAKGKTSDALVVPRVKARGPTTKPVQAPDDVRKRPASKTP